MTALGLTVPAVAPAHAFQLFGICIFGDCPDDNGLDSELIDPKPYAVDLVVVGGDTDVENAVKQASALWSGRNEPAAGSAGLLARAQSDYQRILAALYNDARYGGDISIIADGRQVNEIRPGYNFADGTQFSIRVAPVGQFAFGGLSVEATPPPSSRADAVDSFADIGFVTGEPARANVINLAGAVTVEGWRQQGYAKAELVDRNAVANHANDTLRVDLRVDPGRRAVYGPVTVDGARRMNPDFIAHQTGIEPGREFDPDDLERAYERLQRLGVFSVANVKEGDAIAADGTLPITVVVEEQKLRRIGAGVSYSTVDGFGSNAYWLHRNLFGRAERLRFEAGVSGVSSSLDLDTYDYRLGATLGLPGRFTPDTDFEFSALANREVLDSYTRTGGNVAVGVKHYASPRLTYNGSLFADYAEFDDAFGTRRFGLLGVSAGLTYDQRNDKLDPRSGYLLDVSATPFYEWEFGNPGVRFDGEVRAYQAFGAHHGTVLAGRVKAGSIIGPDAAFLPPDRLFFAGGGSSVRGYAYRSIGADGSMDLGGKSLLEASAEIRQQVRGPLSVVGFVDAAWVGQDAVVDFDGDPFVGVGLGVRYNTGLGPIRADLAFPLNRRPEDGTFALYAGIGQAF